MRPRVTEWMHTFSWHVLRHLPLTLGLLWGPAAFAGDWISKDVAALLTKAQAGDVAAEFQLGYAYESGSGVSRNQGESMRWYRAAAEGGYAEAQNSIGSILQSQKHYTEARSWYEMAANQNHAHATNNLAYLYDLGLGVPQDRQKAFALYVHAADLGWAEAMWNIANQYGAGHLGGPPDLEMACIWTVRAKKFAAKVEHRLLTQSGDAIMRLERMLSVDQMRACREQGEMWSPVAIAIRSDLPTPDE